MEVVDKIVSAAESVLEQRRLDRLVVLLDDSLVQTMAYKHAEQKQTFVLEPQSSVGKVADRIAPAAELA